ncbi:hypothetical protein PV08_07308 [Exophiala spinifera]|uniref:Uncharacterized protein n=1 Tax=Exophiala spinifera TaxID=91928 RepID=A0A0D2BTI0_9EURO|nr:uncharacterized protein PV08_07308 [Exophiala spinifera]KIW14524.1 hypothetical protein PV08_07308 [Exophiala spinifera]
MAGEPWLPTTNERFALSSSFTGESNCPVSNASDSRVSVAPVATADDAEKLPQFDQLNKQAGTSFYVNNWTPINHPSARCNKPHQPPPLSDTIEEEDDEDHDDASALSAFASHLREEILDSANRLNFKPRRKRKHSDSDTDTSPQKRRASPEKKRGSATAAAHIQETVSSAPKTLRAMKPVDNNRGTLADPSKVSTGNANASFNNLTLAASEMNQPNRGYVQNYDTDDKGKGKGKERAKGDDLLAALAELKAGKNATAKTTKPPKEKKGLPPFEEELVQLGYRKDPNVAAPAGSKSSGPSTGAKRPLDLKPPPRTTAAVTAGPSLPPLPARPDNFRPDNRVSTFFRTPDALGHIAAFARDTILSNIPRQAEYMQFYATLDYLPRNRQAPVSPLSNSLVFSDLFQGQRLPVVVGRVMKATTAHVSAASFPPGDGSVRDKAPVHVVLKLARLADVPASAFCADQKPEPGTMRGKKAKEDPVRAAVGHVAVQVVTVTEVTWEVIKAVCGFLPDYARNRA